MICLPSKIVHNTFLVPNEFAIAGETAINNGSKFCIKKIIRRSISRFIFLTFFNFSFFEHICLFFTSYFVVLKTFFHVFIWVLPIFGAHPFFGSNCPRYDCVYLTFGWALKKVHSLSLISLTYLTM